MRSWLRREWARWHLHIVCFVLDLFQVAFMVFCAHAIRTRVVALAESNNEALGAIGWCAGFTMGAALLVVFRGWGVPRDLRGGDDA